MYRATTPLHTFIFEVNPAELFQTILISYAQDGEIILEKGKSDLTFNEAQDQSGNTVYQGTLRLTQEETKLFSSVGTVKVQIRALTYSGEAVASAKMTVPVCDVINDEVLT